MVTPDDLARIFSDEVWPAIAPEATDEDQPRLLVSLGSQPGAGKTRAADILLAGYPHQAVVRVIGDDLRLFDPDYARVLRSDPLRMPEATAASSGRWVGMAIDRALSEERSLLVEGTWRDPNLVLETIMRAKQAGYHIVAAALAVPPVLSHLGVFSRYYRALQEGHDARWVAPDVHERAVTLLPDSVARIAGSSAVDQFSILDRRGIILFDRPYSSKRGEQARSVFLRHFNRPVMADEREFLLVETAALWAYYQSTSTEASRPEEDRAWEALRAEVLRAVASDN